MRRIFTVLVSTLCLIGGLIAVAAPASAASPRHYYLSLGDSLAFGVQPNLLAAGDSNPADYNSYAEYYADLHPQLTLVNYGCSGETTLSMINGGCPQFVQYPSTLHDSYGDATSQLATAEAFLGAHGQQTSLITIDIGSDDLLGLIESCQQTSEVTTCIDSGLPGVLHTMAQNYGLIVNALRPLAPHARLVLFNFYNPFVIAIPGSDQLIAAANDVVDQVAASVSASVADAFRAINHQAGTPVEKAFVCALTWECTAYQDVHPNTLGYVSLTFALTGDLRG